VSRSLLQRADRDSDGPDLRVRREAPARLLSGELPGDPSGLHQPASGGAAGGAGSPYNGIRTADLPEERGAREGVIIAGRIVPNKGIREAIDLAHRIGERLLIVGDTTPYLPWSEAYYREQVAPHVDGDRVRHIRNLSHEELLEEMSRARAFLFPLQWEEPFGLVVIEAMAVGTPVLTLPRGAMPELVEDGRTGFVRPDLDDLAVAWKDIDAIDRESCRRHVREKFAVDRMVEGYLQVYDSLSGG
jgi:glycosyltransferase involved in cell wall biosynthesis